MALVTFTQAANHLRLSTTQSSPPSQTQLDLELKIEQASSLVLIHMKRENEAGWTSETDPTEDADFAAAQSATLLVLTHLWRFRGDDAAMPDLSLILGSRLSQHRVPTLA